MGTEKKDPKGVSIRSLFSFKNVSFYFAHKNTGLYHK